MVAITVQGSEKKAIAARLTTRPVVIGVAAFALTLFAIEAAVLTARAIWG